MRYSIITPTIVRPSLSMLCNSLNCQTERSWEHILLVDRKPDILTNEKKRSLSLLSHAQRSVLYCTTEHHDYGQSCRRAAWDFAKGEYLLYIDDDDHFYNATALSRLNHVDKMWAVFPMLRWGARFINNPPGLHKTGTGMFMVRKEAGPWIDLNLYDADGYYVEELKKKYEYQVLTDDYITVQPKQGKGEE